MRPIWTGAIGFGLVNIPVNLYSATKASSLDLDMLDKSDLANIHFKRVNENTGKEVSWENIVKGYKYEGEYVVVTPDDFEKASPEKSKTIDISSFVKEDEIDSIYYETPYYLEPVKSGVKAYNLLREALAKTNKVGVASFVLRTKESLVILKPSSNLLILNKIRFAEEIRDSAEINISAKNAGKKTELDMAVSLINQLSKKFDVSAYKDTYSAELLKLIEAKAGGHKPKAPKLRVVHSQAKDLMAQLKASLNQPRKKAS